MTAPRSTRWSRIALTLAGVIVSLFLVEGLVRLFRVDDASIAGAVLFQRGDMPVFRVSSDPIQQYELDPGASCLCQVGVPPHRVTIDRLGARHPTHPEKKEPGVFRILAFGGSTLYGSGVNDEETTPAALERHLNSSGSGRFEVWNYGALGYTLLQEAHLARKLLPSLDPDLILVHLHNRGPRPRFQPLDVDVREVRARAADDPYFVDELFPEGVGLPLAFHRRAFAHSALYRALAGLVRRHERAASPFDYIDCSESLDRAEARALQREADARGVPVYYVVLPPMPHVSMDEWVPGLAPEQLLQVDKPGSPQSFYLTHPAAPVLDAYGELLAGALRGPIAAAKQRRAAADAHR
jgi:hypothetical protein